MCPDVKLFICLWGRGTWNELEGKGGQLPAKCCHLCVFDGRRGPGREILPQWPFGGLKYCRDCTLNLHEMELLLFRTHSHANYTSPLDA